MGLLLEYAPNGIHQSGVQMSLNAKLERCNVFPLSAVRRAVARAMLDWAVATHRDLRRIDWSSVVERFKADNPRGRAENGTNSKWIFVLDGQRITQDAAKKALLRHIREALRTSGQ